MQRGKRQEFLLIDCGIQDSLSFPFRPTPALSGSHCGLYTLWGQVIYLPEIEKVNECNDSNYVRLTVSASGVFFAAWPDNCRTMTPWIQ